MRTSALLDSKAERKKSNNNKLKNKLYNKKLQFFCLTQNLREKS